MNNKILFYTFISILCLFIFSLLSNIQKIKAATNQPEIYITKFNAPDPKDKNYITNQGTYGEALNLNGNNFAKSQEVQIYLDEDYLGTVKIEDKSFTSKLKIAKQQEQKQFTIKVVGEARNENLDTTVIMVPAAQIPTWVIAVGGLIILGIGSYYLFLRFFKS